jgi:hypothetical protein
LRYNTRFIDLGGTLDFLPGLNARVAELVDALDLGSSAARRESSSLSFRTINLTASINRFLIKKTIFTGNATWQHLLKQSVV